MKRRQSKENKDEKQSSGANSPQKSNKSNIGNNFTSILPTIENNNLRTGKIKELNMQESEPSVAEAEKPSIRVDFASEMRLNSQRDDKLRDSNRSKKEDMEEMIVPKCDSRIALKSSNSDSKKGREGSV